MYCKRTCNRPSIIKGARFWTFAIILDPCRCRETTSLRSKITISKNLECSDWHDSLQDRREITPWKVIMTSTADSRQVSSCRTHTEADRLYPIPIGQSLSEFTKRERFQKPCTTLITKYLTIPFAPFACSPICAPTAREQIPRLPNQRQQKKPTHHSS